MADSDDDDTKIVVKQHTLRVRYPLQAGNGAKDTLKTLVESAVNDLLVSKKSQYQSPSNPHRGDDDMLVNTCRILMKAAAAQTSSNARLNSSRTLQMRRKASEASKASSSGSTTAHSTTRTSHSNSASSLMNLSSSHPQHQKAFETSIRSLRSDTSAREEDDDDDLPPSFWKDVPSLSKSHNSHDTRSTSLVPHDSDQESSYADDDTSHEEGDVDDEAQEQAPGAFPAPGLPEGVVRHRNSRISRFGRWVSSVTESASNTSLASMVEKEKSEQLAIAAEVVEKEAIDEKIRQDIEANVRRKIIQESKQAEVCSSRSLEFGVADNDQESRKNTLKIAGICVVGVAVILALVFGLLPNEKDSGDRSVSDEGPPSSPSDITEDEPFVPMLSQVRARGFVRCGVNRRSSDISMIYPIERFELDLVSANVFQQINLLFGFCCTLFSLIVFEHTTNRKPVPSTCCFCSWRFFLDFPSGCYQ